MHFVDMEEKNGMNEREESGSEIWKFRFLVLEQIGREEKYKYVFYIIEILVQVNISYLVQEYQNGMSEREKAGSEISNLIFPVLEQIGSEETHLN
ncbi:hypothetical protein TSUD_100100 [Trifolium subterraneum]|uniref:Uncharacterized protein n=1 Tax=Trifolium subterraneum TaxID=3900 RepID=A0A2Z6NUN9_TRISU|nr:hypothetical protein TSUD_100100 [Trifolium subterraneum]